MGIHLVTLIGPPAVGKMTVGRGLAETLRYRFLHNHLTFDLAHTLHPYGTPEFFTLCDQLREDCLDSVARNGTGGLVTTFCATGPGDVAFLDESYAVVAAHGGHSTCVLLQAENSTLLKRVEAPERRGTNKVHDPKVLQRVLSEYDYSTVPSSVPLLYIDTDNCNAQTVVSKVIDGLSRL